MPKVPSPPRPKLPSPLPAEHSKANVVLLRVVKVEGSQAWLSFEQLVLHPSPLAVLPPSQSSSDACFPSPTLPDRLGSADKLIRVLLFLTVPPPPWKPRVGVWWSFPARLGAASVSLSPYTSNDNH